MRKLLVILPIIFLSFSLTYGQDAAELSILRSLLAVPANTPVVSNRPAELPSDKLSKVYIDASGDSSERDGAIKTNLTQWIDEWNKGEHVQRAKLEIVSDSAEANVALIHFTDFPYAIDFVSGNASGSMDVNPRSGQSENGVLVSNTLRMTMIVYTYIVIIEPKALNMVHRRKDVIMSKTTVLASESRSREATASLKKEIDKEVNKRKAKSQEGKNAKSPEYKLRDEFARWLTSGTVPAAK
jgi:hypothetical protein